MKTWQLLCAAIFLFSSILTISAEAQISQVDPHRHWRILETTHFEIIYDANQKELASVFANEAERAHNLLMPIFKTGEMKKVPITIADVTDSSNGSATPLPRSQIEVYPVLPFVTDTTSEYYDWPRELVTHEYTHILNFEPTSGIMGVLHSVFGSIIRPDGFLPRWYLEGLAVEMESELTPVGRGRSHYYSALVRALVEEDKLNSEGIDRIGVSWIPSWPRGQRPYTYGFFLMHELSEVENHSGSKESIYKTLNDRYGRRFPWFINEPVEDYFGLDYAGLLNKTYQHLEETGSTQLATLKAVKKESNVKQAGYFNMGAQISPDHLKLAAVVDDFDDYPSIQIWTRTSPSVPFDLKNGVSKVLVTHKDIHQLSWRKDSRHLVYDHSDNFNHFNFYSDLFEIDVENPDRDEKLTRGLRAREPAVLADQSLVFVQAKGDKTVLSFSNSKGENPEILFAPPFGERVSAPRPYRDGVIYSHRDRKGKEWIEYISLKDKKPIALTHVDHIGQMHVMPVADQSTENGFFFAGSDSGVLNIYHGDGVNPVEAVTNVSTYVTSPEIDPTSDTIIFSRMGVDGFKLDLQTADEKISAPKEVSELYHYPNAEENEAPATKIESDHRYQGVKYLFPQYFIPFVYFLPGGEIFSASTSGSDPLAHHIYSASVGYDTRGGQPTEEFLYSNGSFPFALNFAFGNDYVYLVGANLTEHFTLAQINSRHYFIPDSNKWIFGPQITFNQIDYSPNLLTEFGPGATLYFNNVTPQKDFQISPESGIAFSLGYDYYLASWGNTSYPTVYGNFSSFLTSTILPKHHVLSQKLSASVAPPQNSIFTGYRQAGGEYVGSLFETSFLVRGYPVGEFLGYRLVTENLEYRFPLSYKYSGYDTLPLFIDRWHGAVIFDAATLDGQYYNSNLNPGISTAAATKFGKLFAGAGAELRCDFEAFYNIPLVARLGAYYGFTPEAFGGVNYYLGFGIVQ